MSNSVKRVLAALFLLPVFIYATFLGGYFFATLVAIIALVSQWEYLRLFEVNNSAAVMLLSLLVGALAIASVLFNWNWAYVFVALGILIMLMVFSDHGKTLNHFAGSLSSLVYPVGLLCFLLLLRDGNSYGLLETEAFKVTMTAFVGIWFADTGAYYVGRSLGSKPMAPVISPKKTWEGFSGGVVFAALGLFLVFHYFLPFLNIRVLLAWILIASVVGPIGDLAESKLKRAAGVKDSSNLIPGHGGMLDRFDSMILAAPFFYLSLVLLR